MSKTKTLKTNFFPTPGNILIEPFENETKTASGLYIPETANAEKPQKGKVLAVGDEEILVNGLKKQSPVKIGDTVIYKKWGGSEVKEGNKEYLFVKFEDILAIVK